MKTYKINEIFYSLQGEGMYTGFPVVFVRFSGCNRRCTVKLNGFSCDTKHEEGDFLTAKETVDLVKSAFQEYFDIKLHDDLTIVATGGEPLQQLDQELVDLFHEEGFLIAVETNGSIVPSFKSDIDWLTVSPKDHESWVLKSGSELKVVYTGQDLDKYFESEFNKYFLQPASMKNIQETIEEVKKDPRWALSFQQQKILNIR